MASGESHTDPIRPTNELCKHQNVVLCLFITVEFDQNYDSGIQEIRNIYLPVAQ